MEEVGGGRGKKKAFNPTTDWGNEGEGDESRSLFLREWNGGGG